MGRKYLSEGSRVPLGRQKVVVAVRDEAEEAAAEPAVGGDRDAGEAVRRFDLQHVAHSRLGPEDRGIDDEALLEPLHSSARTIWKH